MKLYPAGTLSGLTGAQALALLQAVLPELLLALAFIYIAKWKIFRRAGYPGWKCLIPFYGGYLTYKIGWRGKYYWYSVIMTILMIACHEMIDPKRDFLLNALITVIDFATVALNVGIYPMLAVKFDYNIIFMILSLIFTEPFLLYVAWGKHLYGGNPEEGVAPEAGYVLPPEKPRTHHLDNDDDDDFYNDDDGGSGGLWR